MLKAWKLGSRGRQAEAGAEPNQESRNPGIGGTVDGRGAESAEDEARRRRSTRVIDELVRSAAKLVQADRRLVPSARGDVRSSPGHEPFARELNRSSCRLDQAASGRLRSARGLGLFFPGRLRSGRGPLQSRRGLAVFFRGRVESWRRRHRFCGKLDQSLPGPIDS
jgi:hypothetical protein